jgi:small subunit ribosomal protein S4
MTKMCPITRRPEKKRAILPGQHGAQKKKVSEYSLQLREKQKAKRIYGVLEAQFRNYFATADNTPGVTGENLLRLLELRLDNVVYRLGYGRSRTEARQVVRHNHVTVNGKKVNIPSYRLRTGDLVAIKEKSFSFQRFKDVLDITGTRIVPEWLSADHANLRGSVLAVPNRDQIDTAVHETLIVELYSK